jgi:hypothetical protein
MVPSPLVHHPCWFPALLNLFHGSITFASFTCASITVDSRLHHLSSITIIWRSQGSITSVPSRGANHMYECMCMTIFVHIHIRIHVLTYMEQHWTTYILSKTQHTYLPTTLTWTPTIKGKLTSRLHTGVLAINKNTMIVCIYTSNKLGPFQIRYNEVTVVWRSIIYYSADFKDQQLEVNGKVPTAHWKK